MEWMGRWVDLHIDFLVVVTRQMVILHVGEANTEIWGTEEDFTSGKSFRRPDPEAKNSSLTG